MSMLGTGDFERSAEVDEEVFHKHWCEQCYAHWRHHDQECGFVEEGVGAFKAVDLPCPLHADSADEEVRGRG